MLEKRTVTPGLIDKSAFLIVDMQSGFFPSLKPEEWSFIRNVRQLHKMAHRKHIEPIFIGWRPCTSRLVSPNGPRKHLASCQWCPGAFLADVRPCRQDALFLKSEKDAFSDPTLAGYLRERKVEHFFIAGLYSDNCVRETARNALLLGFGATIILDAVYPSFTPERYAEYFSAEPILYGDGALAYLLTEDLDHAIINMHKRPGSRKSVKITAWAL